MQINNLVFSYKNLAGDALPVDQLFSVTSATNGLIRWQQLGKSPMPLLDPSFTISIKEGGDKAPRRVVLKSKVPNYVLTQADLAGLGASTAPYLELELRVTSSNQVPQTMLDYASAMLHAQMYHELGTKVLFGREGAY